MSEVIDDADNWVVVDKSSSGTLRARDSQESLYFSDGSNTTKNPRVHVRRHSKRYTTTTTKNTNKNTGTNDAGLLAPELVEWINRAASDSNTSPPFHPLSKSGSTGGRSSVSSGTGGQSQSNSYRTNSSSVGSNRQRRRGGRRSSIHGTSVSNSNGLAAAVALDDAPFADFDCFNDGMFVAKVLEIQQIGATKPMNLQCVAQVGDQKFVIPPVQTRQKSMTTWSAQLDDTFVFDVSRQFTFNLSVYGNHPPQPRLRKPPSSLASRISLSKRNHNLQNYAQYIPKSHSASPPPFGVPNSMAIPASGKMKSKKFLSAISKVFRPNGKHGMESGVYGYNPSFCDGIPEEDSPLPTTTTFDKVNCSSGGALRDCSPPTNQEAFDEAGRKIIVQSHLDATPILGTCEDQHACNLPNGNYNMMGQMDDIQQSMMPRRNKRISYFGRSRAQTATSTHDINYNGPRMRSYSNASTINATPKPLGELFLDFKVDRRDKRRATFVLPVVNQEQVAMRGGSHVEMAVVVEFGIIVHETIEERYERQRQEREEKEYMEEMRQRQETLAQWDMIDQQDKEVITRGYVNIFTRSARASTWRRYWAVLSPSRILLYDTNNEEETPAIGKIPLLHIHDAGIPETDLVNIGPTGIELRLSPLSMTDRHRRQSAHPKNPDKSLRQIVSDAYHTHPMPELPSQYRTSCNTSVQGTPMTTSSSTMTEFPEIPQSVQALGLGARAMNVGRSTEDSEDDDTAMLYQYSEWQCRIYFLLNSVDEREKWLELIKSRVLPAAEHARMRGRQRKVWIAEEEREKEFMHERKQVDEEETGDDDGSNENDGSGQMGLGLSTKPAAKAKSRRRVISESIGRTLKGSARIINLDALGIGSEFGSGGNITLVGARSPRKPSGQQRAPLPKMLYNMESCITKERKRTMSTAADSVFSSSSEDSTPNDATLNCSTLTRRDSGKSTVLQVVGKAKERRPGTVSRKFLFVWNINDI